MDREPEVHLSCKVRARELRFERKPAVDIVAFADSPAIAELESERDNLPDDVEPGVVYRDVSVRWRVAVWMGDPGWDEAVDAELRTRRLSRGAGPQKL
jgi:hypothetical protein